MTRFQEKGTKLLCNYWAIRLYWQKRIKARL